jgi:hypothetical protein
MSGLVWVNYEPIGCMFGADAELQSKAERIYQIIKE